MIRTLTPTGHTEQTGRSERRVPFTLLPGVWLARALLEAPDVDGQPGEWTVLETEAEPSNPSAPFTTHDATLADGWYMLQWFNDARVSVFSEPVRLSGTVASGPAALPVF